MTGISDWISVLPEFALILSVLTIPGVVVALCLRFRAWDAIALAAPLSLGVLTIADIAASRTGVQWGLPVIAVSAGVVAGLSALLGWVVSRHAPVRVQSISRWTPRGQWIAALVTLGAAVASAWVATRGIGTPDAVNQTFDAAFHVNSIKAVADVHSAMPSVFSQAFGQGDGGFYPPLFAGVASLGVTYAGLTPVAAANVAAVAMAFVWPLVISIAVRRFARPSVFGYSIAMVGSVTISLFPALLLNFGTLWPNALSYLALAPVLVLFSRLLGLGSGPDDPDPHGSVPKVASVAACGLAVIGMAFAHPGVLFLCFYLAIPVLIWFGWRYVGVLHAPIARGNRAKSLLVVAAVGVLFEVVVEASYQVSSIAAVRRMYWSPSASVPEAIVQVFSLRTDLSSANLAMALLMIVGLVVAWQTWRGRYLVASFAVVGTLAVLTTSVQTHISMHWTGFWYNDPHRMFAALPVVVLPLIALGADATRARLAQVLERVRRTGRRAQRRFLSSMALAAACLCLGVVALQGGLGMAKPADTIANAYRDAHWSLVLPDGAAMLERLQTQVQSGMTIAGDPFSGEILAEVLSGHQVAFPTFRRPLGADQALVAKRFSDYQIDPQVCAAVQRLKIEVVIDGRRFGQEGTTERKWFAGFADLENVPGLTPLDAGGGIQAYRVAPCNSKANSHN